MSTAPLLQLVRVIGRTTGKRAVYLALPLYFAVGIIVFILFAGNGMNASDVTGLALKSVPARLSLLLGWSMLTLPVARLFLSDPQTFFLRVLPVPRWWLLGVALVGLAFLQLAWLVLWLRGAGALAGASALFAALGLQGFLIARPRAVTEWFGLASVALGWSWAPAPLALACLVPASLFGLRQAWLRGPEPNDSGRHRVWTANAWLAAATAFGISAYRSNGSVVARAVTLASLAFVGVHLGIRHNPDWSEEQVLQVASAVWGGACLLAGVTLARPVLHAEAELTLVLDACGTPLSLRALSGIGLLVCTTSIAGGAVGLVLAASGPTVAGGASLALQLASTGSAWAALAMALVRIMTRGSGRDSGRQLLAQLALYVAAGSMLLAGPLFMLLFLVVAAALASAYSTRFGVGGSVPVPRGA